MWAHASQPANLLNFHSILFATRRRAGTALCFQHPHEAAISYNCHSPQDRSVRVHVERAGPPLGHDDHAARVSVCRGQAGDGVADHRVGLAEVRPHAFQLERDQTSSDDTFIHKSDFFYLGSKIFPVFLYLGPLHGKANTFKLKNLKIMTVIIFSCK